MRRYINDNYGEKKLYEGGLSVRTTLDPKLQVLARKTLTDGLVQVRRDAGLSRRRHQDRDHRRLGRASSPRSRRSSDVAPWRLAVVLEVDRPVGPHRLPAGARPERRRLKERETGTIPLDGVKWAKAAIGPDARARRRPRSSQVLEAGDVVYVEPIAGKDGQFRLRQVPEISGAMVAMDPQTGRVLAMVGGFSYDQSQFNRATQALRQPGSSFKPFVYAAALDNGYTPSSVVLDAPLEIDTGSGVWQPENYEGKFYGPSTLRFGIEHSRNVMTVRLAQDIGMPLIAEYAKRFGVYDNLPPYLSFSLGAGETTLMRMVGAYAMFDNGGTQGQPTLIDRIQDRYGHTIYQHDAARMPRLRRHQVGEPARADAGRQARAGARSDDRLPDHLDDGRRGPARHRRRSAARRSASRSPARPAPPTTRRTSGSSASRPTSWSASSSATTSRATSPTAPPAARWRRRSSGIS